jgi:hypothetical protein
MRAIATVSILLFVTCGDACFAQDTYKASVLKEAAPESVAAEIRAVLDGQAFRVQNGDGKTLAEIWLRKATPAAEKPAGPKGAIQFPFLADGELIGAVQFATEGNDYRDQPIAKGVYTLRYGLQPVNGDHLGVSTFRDYSLLLPASKDKTLTVPLRKQLEERSAESAGTSHPAVFLMQTAPADAGKTDPSMIHDAEKNTWSIVVPLNLQVGGKGEPIVYPVSLVIVGAAPA